MQGTDPTSRPYLLTAHLDVVPEGDADDWDRDPFDAGIVGAGGDDLGSVYGRGAIDDKHSLVGILQALRHKVRSGEQPRRTFYVAFGHDEEVIR